jgi:hypothetical protein
MALDEAMSAELAAELAADDRELERAPVDPRDLRLRFSRMKERRKSALHYWQKCQDGDNDAGEALADAKAFGKKAHAVALRQPYAVFGPGVFNGKSYKGQRSGAYWEHFKKEHRGKVILSASEERKCLAIADALFKHPEAGPMLYSEKTQLEVELDWTHPLGRECQSHIDAYQRGAFVADLKTCRDVSPDKFQFTAEFNHYHSQLAFYVACVEALGHPTPDAFIIAVESVKPYAVVVFQLDAELLELGRRQCHLWMEDVLNTERTQSWRGWDTVQKLSPRKGDAFTVIVDGDDVAA